MSLKALSRGVQELRVHLCQTSKGSSGVRDFIAGHYLQLKEANPALPVLVREASGIKATVTARFPFGKEKTVAVEGLDAKQVGEAIEKLSQSA